MIRLAAFLWKFALGALFCLTPVTAILVLGWTGRAMRRSAVRTWHRRSARGGETGFADAMKADPGTAHLANWPNWIVSQTFRADLSAAFQAATPLRRRIALLARALFGSLRENLVLGLQLAVNCWVITLPASLLWLLGWWGGWENSFNKGYEQAWVGPTVALTGVTVFVIAMFHLPLAQARQAVTGRWRSFYDFSLARGLRRFGRMSALWLVILYLLAGLLVTGAKIAPLGLGNWLAGLQPPLPPENIEQIAGAWNLAAAALVFGLFVALRLAAARQYARSLAAGLAGGAIDVGALHRVERDFLSHFGLDKAKPPASRGLVVRSVLWSGTGIGAVATTVLVALGWGAFSFQLFLGQFLNHNWVAWLNMALVQLPWLR